MLDVSPENFLKEIDAARRLVNKHIQRAKELTQSMIGFDFDGGRATGKPSPDNYVFEFMTLMLGRLLYDNPAVSITSPFSQYEFITDALQDCLEQWKTKVNLRGSQFKAILQGVVAEQLLLFGAMLTRFVPDPLAQPTKDGRQAHRPVVEHIPYWRFFKDHRACPGITPRLMGHMWVKDYEDVLNDPTYNTDMVKKLSFDAGLDELGEKGTAESGPTRREIVGYEIWVPDQPNDTDDPALVGKLHGKVYTLGVMYNPADNERDVKGNLAERKPLKNAKTDKQALGYLRDPQPFYGPATGPYVEFGGVPVAGSPYTLSALMATKEQGEEVNAHHMAIQEAAMQMKDLIICDSKTPGIKQALKNGQHGHVYSVRGFNQSLFSQVHIGGPSAEQIQYAELATERRDRVLGMSEAMRGEAQTGKTATADNIAAQANNVRIDLMASFVKDAVAQVYRNIAFYMFDSDLFVSRLSQEYFEKYGIQPGQVEGYSGGDHPQSHGLRFEDLCVDIQPYSMERVDPLLMQTRMQQVVNLELQLAQARVQFPFINWKMLDDQLARAHNFRWMGTLVNQQMLDQYMQAQAAAAQHERDSNRQPPQLPYQVAPADIKAQIEQAWGLQPSRLWSQVPLADPNQPKQSGNPALAGGTNLSQLMLGKAGMAGAPGAGNASRGNAAASTTGMGASAMQGRAA